MDKEINRQPAERNLLNKSMEVVSGNSPVIITVPHNGDTGWSLRRHFLPRDGQTTAESGVWKLVQAIAGKTEQKPTLIRQRVARLFLDCNRERYDAFNPEDNRLAVIYDYYHQALADLIRKCLGKYGKAVLLDIHGFQNQPDFGEFDIILGKRVADGRVSTEYLDSSFTQAMSQMYRIYTCTAEPKDGELFPGGHTIRYHKVKFPQIDALQIEINIRIRKDLGKFNHLAELFSSWLNKISIYGCDII